MNPTHALRLVATFLLASTCWATNALACTDNVKQSTDGVLVSVPGVIGDPEHRAIECLQRYGYTPQRGGTEVSSLPVGVVTRISPPEGSETRLFSESSGGPAVAYWVSSGPALLIVPNVVGENLLAGMLHLRIQHFSLGNVTTQASEQPPGTIIDQTPDAGMSAEPGSRVDVVVSAPFPQVPDVVGANEDEAIRRIKEHFTPRQAERLPSEKPAGSVLRQDPAGGRRAAPGSDVSYWIASGRNYVPDVIGRDAAGAAGELQAAGFGFGTSTQQVDMGDPGRVLGQMPTPNTLADVGTAVDVWISRELRVPNVVDLQEALAIASLHKASLLAQLAEESLSPEPRGKVLSTDPPADTRVREGSVVRYSMTSGKNGVPDVEGRATGDAASILQSAGLRLGKQTARPAAGAVDIVLDQVPSAGEILPVDSPVDVVVSSDLPIVPDTIGKTRQAAEAMIHEAQFVPAFAGTEPSARPAGTILRTDPVAGTREQQQARVRYWTASGENLVPDLSHKPRADAERLVMAQGFVLGKESERYAPTDAATVIGQRPEAQTMLALGRPIAITLGSAVRRVPDLVGTTPEQARAALAEASLSLGNTTTEYRFTDVGRIVSQRPVAGTQIAPETLGNVAVVIAKSVVLPIVAGSTTLAVLVLGIWWTQMRPWPWHWPPTVGMRAHLAPVEPPLPEFGPLDHDPARDVRLRVAVIPGDPLFDQEPLPITGIKVV